WNVRLTYSGVFVHSAPWSTAAQGSANVSHGCINMSPANAKWFYDFTNRGDIVEVKGTSRKLRFGNGPTPWAKSWEEWVKGSATGEPATGAQRDSAGRPAAPAFGPTRPADPPGRSAVGGGVTGRLWECRSCRWTHMHGTSWNAPRRAARGAAPTPSTAVTSGCCARR